MKRLVRFALVSLVVIVTLVFYLWIGRARDISNVVEQRLKVDSRLYIEDLAKELGEVDWATACVVLPYASTNLGQNAPPVLNSAFWVGNWKESEWRIALVDADKISLVATIRFGSVYLVEKDPSGIKCISRTRRPLLKPLGLQSGYEFTVG